MAQKTVKTVKTAKKTEPKKSEPIKKVVKTAASTKITKPKVEAPMIVKPKVAPAPTARLAPGHDQIARRAYELFVASGYTHGQHEQHWLQAEFELTHR